jgi:rod shape-determining protein MreC
MQQIIGFIFKNGYKMMFLLLLIISLFLTINSHSYHKSRIINSANGVSGFVYTKINSVNDFVNLRSENDRLLFENARLTDSLLKINKNKDFKQTEWVGGIAPDGLIISQIIKNSYNLHENYLTINSGSSNGVTEDMGVINDLGIVGVIDKTSQNFATIISVLNTKSFINVKVKKSEHFGTLIWDGKSTGYAQLIDIPRLASVHKGDTIVTGGQSVIFPKNINVGTVDRIYIDNQTNYFTVNIKLFNDMTDLGKVYLIKNKLKKQFDEIEKTIENE